MYTDSDAMRAVLSMKSGIRSTQLLRQREPVPPYGINYGQSNKVHRVSSAPIHRSPTGTLALHPIGPTNPHRPQSAINPDRRPTDVSNGAPYGARMYNEPAVYGYTMGGRGSVFDGYSTLSDPHLQEYYTKKFSVGRPTPGGRSGRPSSASSSMSGRSKSAAKSGKDKLGSDVIYKISVITGDKKGASTDAKVFVVLKGTKGRLPKQQLTKIKISAKTKKKLKFKFGRGTTHVFKMTGKDIGDLTSINIEHDGLTKAGGWFLDQVEIVKRIPKTGKEKSWIFACSQWLSLHMGDCQISRELHAKHYSSTEYEVVVVTGDEKGAGTDANVSLTIFGKSGNTTKLPLKATGKNSFERNHSDIFKLKTKCCGPLTKVRVEHDNTGIGPGWYLDRVVVTDLRNSKWKYYFPCGQWLAKDEGDGATCRDLLGATDPAFVRKFNKYKVSVYTGEKRGSGTDANVTVQIFGEAGDSGERKLDNNKNNFERGRVDEFFVECPCLGTMQRLRIGHDNSGAGPGWFLDKVIVDDMEAGRVYDFPCQRWLAKDEDDGSISRDLLCNLGPLDAPPGVPYTIKVMTSDKSNAGTSARVYIMMYGGKDGEETSGKIWLDNGKFSRGRTDIFNVEVAKALSPLSRLEVGHDNTGPGSGWHLEKISVNCPSAGVEQWFMCDKWFALDEGDCLIERVLYENKRMRISRKKQNTWHVWVHTSDMRGAGTDANVYFVAYGKTKDGEYKKSDEIPLDNKGDNFEAGQVDRFKVEMDELGRLYKLRVGHDGSGSFAGWHLDKIELESMHTKKRYVFNCGRWLAEDEDDGCIIREIPAEGEDIKKPQPLVNYNVQVVTGKKSGAGTDANVFLNIFGEQGDTGERPLSKSKTHGNKFEKGNVDEFGVEAVTLKHLKKIRIGHDGTSTGDGWFLDKVIVTPEDNSQEGTVFECNRWLDVKEDDGLIVREITAGGSQMLSTTSYHVSVKTGDVWGGGTDANVVLKIFGEKGDTGNLAMLSADNTKNKFERGRTDLFKLEATDIGKIEKIRIGHDGANPGSGWFLDEVRVDVPSQGQHYIFACHRWLDTKEEDGQLEVDLEPTTLHKGAVRIPYELTVWTGEERGAGTDANVFIQMYGEYGKTEEYQLRNRTDNFEQGQTDKFKLEAEDVGPLLKVRIGHDGSGMFDGWFLEKLLIQRHCAKTSKRRKRHRSSFKEIRRGDAPSDSEDERKSLRSRSHSMSKRGRHYDSDEFENESRKGRNGKGRGSLSMRSRSGSIHKRTSRYDSEEEVSDEWSRHKYKGKPVRNTSRAGRSRRRNSFSDEEDRSPRRPGSRGSSRHRHDSDYESEEDIRGKRTPSLRRKSIKSRADSPDSAEEYGRRSQLGRKKSTTRKDSDSEDDRRSLSARRKSKARGRKDSDSEDDRRSLSARRKSKARGRKDSDSENDRRSLSARRKSKARGRKDSDSEDGRRSLSARRKSKARGRKDSDSEDDRRSLSARRKSKARGGKESGSEDERRSLSARRKSTLKRGKKDPEESEDDSRLMKKKKKGFLRDFDKDKEKRVKKDREDDEEDEIETYWFVCQKWFAKSEDDGKLVRELLPTDEQGNALDTGLSEIEYKVVLYTGDKFGAGTDANVFINISGEYGDTGERHMKDSDNINKFERNQNDVFTLKAVELGRLKKVKVRHDNKGGGAAWFLGHVEITDPKARETYFFPCQRWLATDQDDGQIARELVAVDKHLRDKLGRKDSTAIRDEIALETKAAMTTFHVYVYTGDKFGAGTDANVYVILHGEHDDTGKMFLKSSKTNKDKFERNQMDEFVIEAVDIGDLQKIKIGHDNAGGGGAWFLDHVEIDSPSLGKKWLFPCGRWLAKKEDDGKLERELWPQDVATEEYIPCIPYEITVHTSDVSGAGTDADVYVVLYGRDIATQQKSLCSNKRERKKCFEKAATNKFVLELEDVGETIEKIRIGHDGTGWGAGWHLDKVEIRRLKEAGKGSETYAFSCKQWLARGEGDGAIERELVADKIIEETLKRDGSLKRKEKELKGKLTKKNYLVDVHTGDVRGSGTDANVFLTLFGDKGDTGERKLHKSETHSNKFERGQVDRFSVEAADLGKIFKCKIRHDNSMLSPAWFLDNVAVSDPTDRETFVFYCERWLGKGKDDGKIDRTLYVKGYEGDMTSSTLTMHSTKAGSIGSLDSLRSSDPFSKSPRIARRHLAEIPEGPTIPYTVKVMTAEEKDAGTESSAWIQIYGKKKKSTGKLYLDFIQKKGFEPGSIETFSLEAVDVSDVKEIELGHDGVTEGTGWFVKEVEIDMPTKGKHYFFTCKQWLARDKGDGKTSRIFSLQDGDSSMVSYKPMVPYEMTVYTGDVKDAGIDAKVFVKFFGESGTTSDIHVDKCSERFERSRADLVKIEIEDIGPLKKMRIGHDGKGSRVEWFIEKVEMRNMNTGDLTTFKCDNWLSRSKGDQKIVRDLVAYVKGRAQLKTTNYKISVKTSNIRGAGTDANVFALLFGENGDSGELHLKDSETFKDPFENDQLDVFTFNDLLSLGQLIKIRVWHDNKGLGSAWHLSHVEVQDLTTKHRYTFPCDQWLSKSEGDKQIVREMCCANLPSPGTKDKILYEIAVTTTDKKDAGMIHNAWLILEGEIKHSKEFLMENSAKNKILRNGQTDLFTMSSRNLGTLERCIIGAVERDDKPLGRADGHDAQWHCHQVAVTNKTTGDKYIFPCKSWISITRDISRKYAKVLELKKLEESRLTAVRNLGNMKYDVTVVTGDMKGAGTDANVLLTIYGTNGDTGKRTITQRFRDLFERNQTDTFQLEALDLGDLTKIYIEHDNKGWGAGWLLERVEITNSSTNQSWVFPCGKWLDKKKGDGEIGRELLPRD